MSDERSYRLVDDKAAWGPGPWVDEPDKLVWVDDATGLDCMILRNRSGVWCGYVGVPQGHPWHGLGYDDVEADVHGGLTFCGPCQPGAREDEQAICHNPVGRPDDVWWLGFDCAHAWDIAPAHLRLLAEVRVDRGPLSAYTPHGPFDCGDVYRDLSYVRGEVADLAAQAARAAS